LHAKDAQIHPAALRRDGILGPNFFAVHRSPGLGVLDWAKVFRRLFRGGYSGSVDIEGWHDPVFRGRREMEGQRRALRHLLHCRAQAA
jgi:sugar phosphate isomerase/epimerase